MKPFFIFQAGVLVVVLIVILGVTSVGMFRFNRARRNFNRRYNRRTDSTNMDGRSSIYTIYDNEPPPYDIVIQSKLPEYTEIDDPPDYFENSDNCAASGRTDSSQMPYFKSSHVNSVREMELVCPSAQQGTTSSANEADEHVTNNTFKS